VLAFLYQRIRNNILLFVMLLCGAILASAIVSCIPMYSNAIFQRLLIKDLEQMQKDTTKYPGTYSVEMIGKSREEYQKVDKIMYSKYASQISLPIKDKTAVIITDPFNIEEERKTKTWRKSVISSIAAFKNIEEHITLLHGRLPENNSQNDVYEVIVSQNAAKNLDLILNNTHILTKTVSYSETKTIAKVKVVGIFTYKDKADAFWDEDNYRNLDDRIVMLESDVERITENRELLKIYSMKWMYFYDYYELKSENIKKIISTIYEQRLTARVNLNLLGVVEEYLSRQKDLSITLWILTLPFIVIICFFTLMISGLIVKNDENEISVLKSRGAGTFQIFFLYIIQSLIMAGIAFIIGPILGKSICRIMGASNGFMELVSRKSLPIRITAEIYQFSLLAAAIFVVFVLIPAFRACRTSIVQYKRKKNTENKQAIWEKFFLDIVVLLISVYGLYKFSDRQNVLQKTGASGQELQIDPILYMISTLFVIGIGLLFLRLYPYLINCIYQLGKNRWNSVLYYSLINTRRIESNARFIMLFIILSISFGVLSSNQARTINQNLEDKIRYETGADIVLYPYSRVVLDSPMSPAKSFIPPPDPVALRNYKPEVLEYDEVPYREYQNLDGIEGITRVFEEEKSIVKGNSVDLEEVKVLGIVPHEFAKLAWFRNDLLPFHINKYMNVMTQSPNAALLSKDMQEKFDLGDSISIQWGKNKENTLLCRVHGFINYFPTYNPYPDNNVTFASEELNGVKWKTKSLVVVNFSTLQSKLPGIRYNIWIEKKPGVTDGTINDQL